MKFGALLIGAGDVAPALPGVEVDLNDLNNFLLSNRGGAWESKEINILRSPTKSQIIEALLALRNVDYAFISCSGHGEHQVHESGSEGTVFCINKKETMLIQEINPGTKRHLVLVDVCRHIQRIPVRKFSTDSAFAMSESRSKSQARIHFQNSISATSEGRIVLYSCGKNQSAGDDGNGGVFTQALLRAAHDCKPTSSTIKTIAIDNVFAYAKSWVEQVNAPQSPEMNAGRRRDFFPFAVAEI